MPEVTDERLAYHRRFLTELAMDELLAGRQKHSALLDEIDADLSELQRFRKQEADFVAAMRRENAKIKKFLRDQRERISCPYCEGGLAGDAGKELSDPPRSIVCGDCNGTGRQP